MERDFITSLFTVHNTDRRTRTFTGPPGGVVLLCLLFTHMTAQLEYSQSLLVKMDSITSLFIVCRYNNSTGIFTVPCSGNGYYYFSVFFTVNSGEFGYFDVEINGELICTVSSNLTQTSEFKTTSCNGTAYAVEGMHASFKLFQYLVILEPPKILNMYFRSTLHFCRNKTIILFSQETRSRLCTNPAVTRLHWSLILPSIIPDSLDSGFNPDCSSFQNLTLTGNVNI